MNGREAPASSARSLESIRLGDSLFHRDPRRPGRVLLHACQEGAAPVVVVHGREKIGGDAFAEMFASAVPVPLRQETKPNMIVGLAEIQPRTAGGFDELVRR